MATTDNLKTFICSQEWISLKGDGIGIRLTYHKDYIRTRYLDLISTLKNIPQIVFALECEGHFVERYSISLIDKLLVSDTNFYFSFIEALILSDNENIASKLIEMDNTSFVLWTKFLDARRSGYEIV